MHNVLDHELSRFIVVGQLTMVSLAYATLCHCVGGRRRDN